MYFQCILAYAYVGFFYMMRVNYFNKSCFCDLKSGYNISVFTAALKGAGYLLLPG